MEEPISENLPTTSIAQTAGWSALENGWKFWDIRIYDRMIQHNTWTTVWFLFLLVVWIWMLVTYVLELTGSLEQKHFLTILGCRQFHKWSYTFICDLICSHISDLTQVLCEVSLDAFPFPGFIVWKNMFIHCNCGIFVVCCVFLFLRLKSSRFTKNCRETGPCHVWNLWRLLKSFHKRNGQIIQVICLFTMHPYVQCPDFLVAKSSEPKLWSTYIVDWWLTGNYRINNWCIFVGCFLVAKRTCMFLNMVDLQ